MSSQQRRHWEDVRRRKEPSMYDEWLAEEKSNMAAQREAVAQAQHQADLQRAQVQGSLGMSDTTAAGQPSSIRAVTPEASEAGLGRGTTSFERAFIPTSTTTIVGGPGATTSSPSGSSLSSRFRRDRDRDREWDGATATSANRSSPASRNGTVNGSRGMLGRSGSKSNGDPPPISNGREAYGNTNRPRTRTLDERRRERSPGTLRHRHRIGSVNTPQSPIQGGGADYLASVPAATSPPSAPSISSLGSPVQTPADLAGGRSISPMSSSTADSMPGVLPSANTRRIMHLMKTLNGAMSGNVVFRRGRISPWSQSYCFIQEETGSLVYEPRGGEGETTVLVSDLRGSKITLDLDNGTPFINIILPSSSSEVHLKLLNQADFDSWFAALLHWQQQIEPRTPRHTRPNPHMITVAPISRAPEPPPRMSSARSASAGREVRDRANSNISNRRKSVLMTSMKEAPVIKIGKMIFWDTNVTYNNTPASALGQPHSGRPQAYRMQSFGSRRWRRISGQLRENGELKLHSDVDNALISVVQLSQLSRCAIQRLDPSVLDCDFCIAIYPQYTSSTTSNVSLLRPIFLTLENRVLYEVWFVLLRAFTIPALYGPRPDSGNQEHQDAVDMLSTSTLDMFRMERSLHIRVVEAKMYPPPSGISPQETGFVGGHGKGIVIRPEQYGYHVEVLLDNETRGRTAVKYEGLNPLWGETFEFQDLPPVLNSASVAIKRRPPDHVRTQEQHQSKLVHEAYGFSGNQDGGYSGITFDVTCGKVEIYLEELAGTNEIEKWWPVVNMHNQRVGEVLIKARAEEGVILMARDYKPLSDLLHRFSNGLTLQVAQIIPGELKRLSDCLLNIFQVSGHASDWLMALVEEEIDSIHKETPMNRLRYSRRVGSNDSGDSLGPGGGHNERELLVRDMNKNAALEANLLFRGNTLLTKSLDSHMRRIGREYLEEALGAKVREINEKDPDCEVDPNRVSTPGDVERNWRRLIMFTQDIWKSIVATKIKCPIELRRIFRHVRTCAEDRYGDFLRSVSYSSVSGFLFLRFFCPAVLNPKLFGLMKDDMKPRARRTCTLIAKSLQTLANMASFGTKEHWMEPMNQFLGQHRESFKSFIDDVCYVPSPLANSAFSTSENSSPTHTPVVAIADTHLAYTTPMTIMQRLPPTSQEGFPSLPYLIDQARCFADLIQLWLETTSQASDSHEAGATGRPNISLLQAIQHADGDLRAFHDVCSSLHARTQECLSRAERAERPNSALSFRWDEIIDQLERPDTDDDSGFPGVANRIASDPTIVASPPERLVAQLQPSALADTDDEEAATRMYESTPPHSSSVGTFDTGPSRHDSDARRVDHSHQGSLRRTGIQRNGRPSMDSPSASASASMSNVSSAVSSDTEHTTGTTALPSYEREIRQKAEMASSGGRSGSVGFLQHRMEKKAREKEIKERERKEEKEREKEMKEKRRGKALLPPLRKKRDKSGDPSPSPQPSMGRRLNADVI